MEWYIDKRDTLVLADSIRFITQANVNTTNDVAFIEIIKHEILMDA